MTDRIDMNDGFHLGHFKGLKVAQLRKMYVRVRSEVVCRTDAYARHGGFDAFVAAYVGPDAKPADFCMVALNQLRRLGSTSRFANNTPGATTPQVVTWGDGAERAEAVLREARA